MINPRTPSLALVAALLTACGSNEPEQGGRPPKEKEPTYLTSPTTLFGTWQTRARKGTTPSERLVITFSKGEVRVEKRCYSGGRLTASVYSKSIAFNENGEVSATTTSIMNPSVDGAASCTFNYPASTRFYLRDGELYVRKNEQETPTNLAKVSELP